MEAGKDFGLHLVGSQGLCHEHTRIWLDTVAAPGRLYGRKDEAVPRSGYRRRPGRVPLLWAAASNRTTLKTTT